MAESAPCDIKSRGFIPMKEPGLYSVRIHVVGGFMRSDWLAEVSRLAEKYGRGHVHLTARQGVEIPYVPQENIYALQDELAESGLRVGGCGPRVRTMTACQGLGCRHGLIDAQGIAQRLMVRVEHRVLPHKFKVCIAGCPNACPKPVENDFGVQGVIQKTFHREECKGCGLCVKVCPSVGALRIEDKSLVLCEESCIGCGKCIQACPFGALESERTLYQVSLGGKMGRFPKPAYQLPFLLPSESAVGQVLDATLDWYCENGRSKERFGDALERIGVEFLIPILASVAKQESPAYQCTGPMRCSP